MYRPKVINWGQISTFLICANGLFSLKILHCVSFCRSFVAHSGRILDMKALLTNNTKVFISSSNDKSIKVCENETEQRRGARIGKPGKTPRSYQNLIAKISSPEAAESPKFCDWRGGNSKILFCGAPSTFTYPAVLILVILIVLRLLLSYLVSIEYSCADRTKKPFSQDLIEKIEIFM